MSSKSKSLRAFVSSCETQKEDAKPALVPKLRFPEFRGAEAWPANKLVELCDLNKGEQLAASDKDAGGRYPHYNGGISPSSYTARANRAANTIIISEGGNSCGYVQFVTEPFWSGGHNYSLAVKAKVNTLCLFYALQAKQREIMALRIGSGLPNIQKTTLGQFELFLPKQSAEQQKIAECLSSVDELIAAQARKVDALKSHKKGLMQQLFPSPEDTTFP
jgi:type I restriction enzyme S subunit